MSVCRALGLAEIAIFPEDYTSYTHLKEPSPFTGGGNEPDLRCSWCRSLRTTRQRVWEYCQQCKRTWQCTV